MVRRCGYPRICPAGSRPHPDKIPHPLHVGPGVISIWPPRSGWNPSHHFQQGESGCRPVRTRCEALPCAGVGVKSGQPAPSLTPRDPHGTRNYYKISYARHPFPVPLYVTASPPCCLHGHDDLFPVHPASIPVKRSGMFFNIPS